MAKKTSTNKLIVNRRARFDYKIHDQIWTGIVLSGPEVRAARDGHVSLRGAYVTVKNGELWLTNASFTLPGQAGTRETVVDTTSRKLLAKKSEISKFVEAKDQGLTIVPLAMSNQAKYIKVEIATAKGKKLYDKRETIKQRDLDREQKRLNSGRN
ncbi:MAG: SsrA-binding protein SmpB [Candidatus Woesebacteria bacterium]|jgi:SsrA-binding protein